MCRRWNDVCGTITKFRSISLPWKYLWIRKNTGRNLKQLLFELSNRPHKWYLLCGIGFVILRNFFKRYGSGSPVPSKMCRTVRWMASSFYFRFNLGVPWHWPVLIFDAFEEVLNCCFWSWFGIADTDASDCCRDRVDYLHTKMFHHLQEFGCILFVRMIGVPRILHTFRVFGVVVDCHRVKVPFDLLFCECVLLPPVIGVIHSPNSK